VISKIKKYLTLVKTWILRFPMPSRAHSAVPVHQKFWQDGGNDLLASVEEVKDKNVIVLGGYLGDSVERYLKLGARTIDVFEPIPEYFEKLADRFQSESQVNLIDVAAWIRNETLEFWLDGDGTGFSGRTGTRISVKAIRLSNWISSQQEGQKYFIEINIEGSEYALLEDLISSRVANRLETILVQFHNFSPESESQRESIRSKLANSHSEKMNYEWVWEKWMLKESVDKYLSSF
jgi:FkbM family methyltransferase